MMKSICALVHREGSDRGAFQDYYEANHAPLGITHFPFRKYVRNHLIDADDLGYDTISEFWAEDIQVLVGLMSGPVGDIMRADEERFMNRDRTAPAGAEEYVCSAGDPARADGMRVAGLLTWSDGEEGRARALDWARACGREMAGVSADFASSWRQPSFPAQMVLWAPEIPSLSPPSGIAARFVNVRRCETPAEKLAGALSGAASTKGL